MTNNRPRQGSGMRSRNSAKSPTRQGVAARELQEARRKRRQREVMRNRIILGVICLCIFALLITLIVKLLGGLIGSGNTADTSTITFQKNGQVVFEEVIDFDSDIYSKSELKTYTNDLISSFNETYGEEAIKLNKLSVRGDEAYIKTTYKDADCYTAFTSYETFNASYEDAVSAGYDFGELFSTVADNVVGEAQVVDTDSLFAGMQVAIIKENVTVVVPGTITYISNANVDLVEADTVTISQADGNEDASDLVYVIYTLE